MAAIIPGRMTVEMDRPFVVFLIGMRINKPWKLHQWLPVFRAMPRMIRELEADPASGFLGHRGISLRAMIQYWRSLDALMDYARNPERTHWPAWREFNRRVKDSRGDVGLWHETYLVEPGRFEAIYNGMPPTGLGRFGRLVPATGRRERARDWLAAGAADGAGATETGNADLAPDQGMLRSA